ncbi:hypothetical protein TspCOW1_10390 [Thiohalobacter sp. COW1]|uniref:DnaK suppressor protein-like N-terminal domain-containing protein n=1 Tax=Thiohalobacter thiocyanaticus TaxID=585455 RepID=A0A1Z4VR88_9GAMM|nr:MULTISPECIES: hypothetical protein [Thiohalobacter]BAZ93995.1 uncharacterized protein FOKN1_1607 [Thiohalobacter thiocyanaticus]BCO30936.1 hypothetical protein TspCOW1_10390 [Thiohalobacter sp. COW1]
MPIDPEDTDRDGLLQRREALRERLDAIKQDYAAGLDPDSGERAQQLENAEVLAAIARSTAEELEEVERLLQGLPAEGGPRKD